MGKLIRNGIEYGGGNGTDIFEVTQADYDALVQAGTLVHNALYVITDAPNLNETAKQISYDGGTDTVWDKVEACTPEFHDYTATTNANGVIDSNTLVTGGIPVSGYNIISAVVKNNLYVCVLGYYNGRYLFVVRDRDTLGSIGSVTVDIRVGMLAI